MKNPAAPIIGRSDKIIEASGLNNRSPRIAAIIRLRNGVGLVGIGETTKEQKRGGDSHKWPETATNQDGDEHHPCFSISACN